MGIEELASSREALAGQTVLLGDIVRSDIRRVMEMNIPNQSRTLLEHATECLGVLIKVAAGEPQEMET
jgi:hypothetical protein